MRDRRDDRERDRDRDRDRDRLRDRSREVRSSYNHSSRRQPLTASKRYRDDRRDRSRDRYDRRRDDRAERSYRPRDRGNDRERVRSRSRDRHRERSRDRRHRDRGPSPVRDSREHGRRRPHEDDDSHGNGSRNSKRMRTRSPGRSEVCSLPQFAKLPLTIQSSSRPGTSNGEGAKDPAASEPEVDPKVKAERLAKLAAWKEQMQLKKKQAASAGDTSPAGSQDASQTASAGGSPASSMLTSVANVTRPAFDPKAIKKQTQAKPRTEKTTLEGDAAVPTSAAVNGVSAKRPAVKAVTKGMYYASGITQGFMLTVGADIDAKITGFGLNKGSDRATERTSTAQPGNALDEDEDVQRKFRKLPDLQLESVSDAALAEGEQEKGHDDGDNDDLRSDEEEAEAVRQAALKRAEEAQADQHDAVMGNAEDAAPDAAEPMEVDDEIDPLEAFMNNLDQSAQPTRPAPNARSNRAGQLFDDDDGGPDLEAVGDNPEDLLRGPKRNKKEVPTVDHSKVEYEDFEKNFYRESIEVAEMTDDEVATLRAELDNITVRGMDLPKPITKWSQCGFGTQILDVIKDNKFESPTSIQCQALPAIMSGRDTIGIAKTGSGKTLAFVLPMFRHIKDQRPVANLEGPIGVIMAPTRELAVQIHRECKPYLKALNLRGVCAYGGAPIKDQIAELKRGAEVVVCTPGRMIDLLAANQGRVTNLRRVTYVVMDEADRMFDMGFEPQVHKILGNVRPDRQTVLFSATFPKKMESLARKALTRPIEILVGGRSVVAAEITQVIEVQPEDSKFRRVLELLGNLHESDEEARSLIFVERQETADSIFKELGKKGYPSVSVHGGREQIDRDQAIMDFKSGAIPIMVATSVAARGLDVKQLKLVINYDSPNHGEDYVHRAGRTGRAGNTGTAVTFITPDQERYAPFLVRCLEDSKQEVPEELKDMAASHKKKVASGEAARAGSGFGGHGIERLDAARAAERARERGMFKTGDEPEEDDEAKKEKEKKENEVKSLVARAAGKVTDRDAQAAEAATEKAQAPQENLRQDLLEHLTNALKVQKVEKAETPAPPSRNDALARAAAAAANINSRVGKGGTRPGAPADNRGPDAGAFHSTLEINDFPQKARWAVTNRTNVAKILDSTGTSITSKGIFYKEGNEPGPGDEPKLYILVEGDTEVAVQAAMRELSRHLTEGTIQAQAAEAAGGGGGRYRVV